MILLVAMKVMACSFYCQANFLAVTKPSITVPKLSDDYDNAAAAVPKLNTFNQACVGRRGRMCGN